VRLLDLLLPACCTLCGRGGEPVCPACVRALPLLGGPACARCGKPTVARVADCRECRGRRLGFEAAAAAVAFEGRGRDLVLRFKEGGLRGLATTSAGLIATVCPAPACDALTWVPGDRWRTLRRGYHPARELALELADRWGVPALPLLSAAPLRRRQRGLDHVARRRNVRDAFHPAVALSGEPIAVVDDVFTTGATLSACAAALRKGGAGPVAAVTLARVVRI
jgi:predicted amidophosphoribosyltransferase